MLPKIHFLIGLIITLIFYFILKLSLIGIVLFFLSSFLMDFDHYLYFIYEKRNFKVSKAYKWHLLKGEKLKKLSIEEKRKHRLGFYCFHGMEFVFLFFFFGLFISKYFYFISLGIFLHLILDWIKIFKEKGRVARISIIYDFLNKNKFKKIK